MFVDFGIAFQAKKQVRGGPSSDGPAQTKPGAKEQERIGAGSLPNAQTGQSIAGEILAKAQERVAEQERIIKTLDVQGKSLEAVQARYMLSVFAVERTQVVIDPKTKARHTVTTWEPRKAYVDILGMVSDGLEQAATKYSSGITLKKLVSKPPTNVAEVSRWRDDINYEYDRVAMTLYGPDKHGPLKALRAELDEYIKFVEKVDRNNASQVDFMLTTKANEEFSKVGMLLNNLTTEGGKILVDTAADMFNMAKKAVDPLLPGREGYALQDTLANSVFGNPGSQSTPRDVSDQGTGAERRARRIGTDRPASNPDAAPSIPIVTRKPVPKE